MLVKLREAMEAYRRETGERLTYETLAARSGLSKATLQSLASRPSYNARLSTIERLCRALGCAPGELLALDAGTERKSGQA
jgi:putative transcriptional regulator